LHDVWPSAGLVHYIYIFGGSCPLAELCQVQNSLCIQVLRSSILAPLLHSTGAVGVSQTLRHVQGMELWNFRSLSFSTEGGTYIPRAAITLGIGPHSCCDSLNHCRETVISNFLKFFLNYGRLPPWICYTFT